MGKNTNMKAYEKYMNYWDEWHKEWIKVASSNEPGPIKDWPIPKKRKKYQRQDTQSNFIYKYFPEPYLHIGDPSKIKHVFLNINPGGGRDIQDFDKGQQCYLYENVNKNKSYKETISDFLRKEKISDIENNEKKNTTREFFNNRLTWAKSIWGDEISEDNIICADLVPWHTKTESEIMDYIVDNYNLVIENVLSSLVEIACDGSSNPKIIVRGVPFFDLINKWLEEKEQELENEKQKTRFSAKREKRRRNIQQYIIVDELGKFFDKFNSYLAVYEFNLPNTKKTVEFYVFSNGASMDLPIASHKVKSILGTYPEINIKLKDFINHSSNNSV